MPPYDLQSILKDHNGNKRNHFLFFCVILGIDWQAMVHSNVRCFKCLCFSMYT